MPDDFQPPSDPPVRSTECSANRERWDVKWKDIFGMWHATEWDAVWKAEAHVGTLLSQLAEEVIVKLKTNSPNYHYTQTR